MPDSRFVATLAETVTLLKSFFTKVECHVLPEEASSPIPAPARTSESAGLNLLAIREKSGRRWMAPLLIWPAELGAPQVASKEGVPDWSASSPSIRFEFPQETMEDRRLKLGSGAIEWRQEYAGSAAPPRLRAFYDELVARFHRSMSSYVLKRRVRIGNEAKRMVLEHEAQFQWRGEWYPPPAKKKRR